MPEPEAAVDGEVLAEINMAALREHAESADQDFGEAVGEQMQPLRDAIDAYREAERLNLDDYINGTHAEAAEQAWQALVAAREALAAAAAAAEKKRQVDYQAAINAGTKPPK